MRRAANRLLRPNLTGSLRRPNFSPFFDSTQIFTSTLVQILQWKKDRPEWVRDPIAEWVRGSKGERVAELQWVALLPIGGGLRAEQAVAVGEEGEVGVRCATVHLR